MLPSSSSSLRSPIADRRPTPAPAVMGRKLASENRSSTAPSSKSAKSGGGGGKKEKLSVSAMLASMDKPKLASTAASKKSKLKSKTNSYMNELDMPPSSDADEFPKVTMRSAVTELSAAILSNKELKKREKEQIATADADHARKESLREDKDVFNVVIGTRDSAFDPDGDDAAANANLRDISVENFTVSAAGKDLLKNGYVCHIPRPVMGFDLIQLDGRIAARWLNGRNRDKP